MIENSLFTDAPVKKCSYCNLPPKPKKGKEHIFNGFRDAATGQLVCWNCRKKHSKIKSKK